MRQDESPTLRAEDLILSEETIKATLNDFLPHRSGSIYFPQTLPSGMQGNASAEHTVLAFPEEDKILLPLVLEGRCLGIYLAKGLDPDQASPPFDHLVPLLTLTLENLRLYKLSRMDRLTGLVDNQSFLSALITEIESGRHALGSEPPSYLNGSGLGITSRFAVVLLNIDRFKAFNAAFGYSSGDTILKAVANSLAGFCPEQGHLARLGSDEFALLLPDYGPKKTQSLVQEVAATLQKSPYTCPVSRKSVRLSWSIGSAHYPQNIVGSELRLPGEEQAHLLLEKARRSLRASKKLGGGKAFAYSDVLSSGGTVQRLITADRVSVDIGSLDRAEEGQRFSIHSGFSENPDGSVPAEGPHGEIILIKVERERAIGDVLYLTDPSRPLRVGDRLLLRTSGLSENELAERAEAPASELESRPLDFRRFLEQWRILWSRSSRFCLLLCRPDASRPTGADGPASMAGRDCGQDLLKLLEDAVQGLGSCLGSYGADSLILALKDTAPEQAHRLAQQILDTAWKQGGIALRVGLAYHPCLDYQRFETLTNCRKALEHALVLPQPSAVLFDSLTLTISGDRLFAQGDLTEAKQEYSRALLLDEANTLARNSLGICCARLGQLSQSCREFQHILEREPDNLMALYNFGCASLRIGEAQAAKSCFERCLKLQPDHAFSLLRLGKLTEEDGLLREAEELYRRALAISDSEAAASKAMGSLMMQTDRSEQAREHLHRALILNPQDAEALFLLARLYHQEGENPELTERLARKSLELRPEFGDCAGLLEDILRSQR